MVFLWSYSLIQFGLWSVVLTSTPLNRSPLNVSSFPTHSARQTEVCSAEKQTAEGVVCTPDLVVKAVFYNCF